MNGNQQLEYHQYMNGGYPYLAGDGFVEYFQCLPHAPEHYIYPGAIQNQECMYWPMSLSLYRFQLSNPESTSYYSYFEVNDNQHNHLTPTQVNQRSWDYSSVVHNGEALSVGLTYEDQSAVASTHNSPTLDYPEERNVSEESANDAEAGWQDNIDPDNMTYEELLDLGEVVGAESRGLSKELIKLLPTSRYKAGGLFSRKKERERCVICLLTYKMGDQQITLPCKHVYHKKCGTKWLSIKKTCPVCNGKVFSSETRH